MQNSNESMEQLKARRDHIYKLAATLEREIEKQELKEFKVATKQFVGKYFRKKPYGRRNLCSYYFVEKVQERNLIVTTLRQLGGERFELLAHQSMGWKYFQQLRIRTEHTVTKKTFQNALAAHILPLVEKPTQQTTKTK